MLLREQLRSGGPLLSVGLVAADWMSLRADLEAVEAEGVKLLHVDVMDGRFCPAFTLGPAVLSGIRTPLLKEVHLMVEEPLAQLEAVVAAGADLVTFHVEATRHPHRVLQALGRMRNANDPARGIVRGVALNPGTPLEWIAPLRDELDLVVLLAVNPGWGGQSFIPATWRRVEELRSMFGRELLLEIDGGITRENAAEAIRRGADIVVAGSAVFAGGNVRPNIRALRESLAQPGTGRATA